MGKLLFAGIDDDFDANDRSELQMAGQDWECTRSIFVQECYVASLCQIVEKTRKHHFVLWKTRQNKEISFCVFLCNTVWIGLAALGLAILGLDLDFVRILLGLSMTAPRGSCPSSMSSLCFGQNCRCQRAHSEWNFFSYDSYDWLHEPGLSKPIYSGNQGNQGSKDLITWVALRHGLECLDTKQHWSSFYSWDPIILPSKACAKSPLENTTFGLCLGEQFKNKNWCQLPQERKRMLQTRGRRGIPSPHLLVPSALKIRPSGVSGANGNSDGFHPRPCSTAAEWLCRKGRAPASVWECSEKGVRWSFNPCGDSAHVF